MTVTITGQRRLLRELAHVRRALSDPHTLEAAAAAAAEPMRDRAERLAPRSASGSFGNPPGHLASNIEMNTRGDPSIGNARVGPISSAWYGIFAEVGTRPHGNHPGTPPRPFLRPAFDQEAGAAPRRAGRVIARKARI